LPDAPCVLASRKLLAEQPAFQLSNLIAIQVAQKFAHECRIRLGSRTDAVDGELFKDLRMIVESQRLFVFREMLVKRRGELVNVQSLVLFHLFFRLCLDAHLTGDGPEHP
jgi:hypothetical protein